MNVNSNKAYNKVTYISDIWIVFGAEIIMVPLHNQDELINDICLRLRRHQYIYNGVHPPIFPTYGSCVLSVIRFKDGRRRSSVVSSEAQKWSTTPKCIDKRSKNWLDWKVHITLKTQAYDLCSLLFNIIVFVECPSYPDWK